LKEKYVRNIITLKIILGIISYALIIFFALFFSLVKEKLLIIAILGAAVIFDSFMYFFRYMFRLEEKMEYEGILMAAEAFLRLAVLMIMINSGIKLIGVIIVSLAVLSASILNFTINLFVFLRKNRFSIFQADFMFCKYLLKSSFPFVSICILSLLNFRINIMIISYLKGDFSVGLYNANYKLLEQFLLIPIMFSAAVLPTFSRLSDSLPVLMDFLRRSVIFLFSAAIILVALCYFSGVQVVNTVYGSSFRNAGIYLYMISWVLVPFFLKSVMEKLLLCLRKQNAILIIYSAGAVLNTLLNLFLVSRFGINGASLGIAISESLVVIAFFVYIRKLPVVKRVADSILDIEASGVINESVY
ncbi:MAG: polysaccharide biosynthesis C-terminal domain-containing protein, partial [Candidatus Omnitrophica bacterium]|nr:polysaccharide biosynthesis C-terminal domain-containing protein [Candidatus Omnitrophota bacterium]